MGKATGFMENDRVNLSYAPVSDRITHYKEFSILPDDDTLKKQGSRCMDCGIPFCHDGCPVSNMIPDWNDLVYSGKWKEAITALHSTNNFPEFTGYVCPAPCEASCTLNLTGDAVSIKNIERAIVEKAWQEGWIQPQISPTKTGKRVAVIGSGPAGMACAQQLARAGHQVVLFEKANRIGGLLRYGIPDFKMDKGIIDRRLAQMRTEGVEFRCNTHVGVDISATDLVDEFDAVALTGGSEQPRDLPITGRELNGVHFAMDLLPQQNKRNAGDEIPANVALSANNKHVVVIGGGDTGSDCVGTSIRQGALSVTQLELMPKPPEQEDKQLTWPNWPMKLRTSTSHEEGCQRDWSVTTKLFVGEDNVQELHCVRVEWVQDDSGRWQMNEVEGSEFVLKADLVLLAMGFVHPMYDGMLAQLKIDVDARKNVQANTDDYQTNVAKVFAAGDMRRGQSLVVWAIREGRQCARSIDESLMGETNLAR
ncbi:MAG: glutamate synthase subunit beta [Mariprofundaceae bacterium]|nr:glutamate synthase subunit beta [Mariprofundaceae bacterium]